MKTITKKLFPTIVPVLLLTFATMASAHSDENEKNGMLYTDKTVSRLPSQKASEFRATMKEAEEENQDIYEQKRQAHRDLHAILTAPTFDKSAFLAKSKEIRDLHDQIEENRTDAFASALVGLSPRERRMLAGDIHGMRHKHGVHSKNSEYPSPPNGVVKP